MNDPTPEQLAVETLSPYLDRLLVSYAEELNESSRKRKAFFVFLFGGINGLAVARGLTVEQAQAVAVSLLYQELGITPMDGLRVVEFGVAAVAPLLSGTRQGLRCSTRSFGQKGRVAIPSPLPRGPQSKPFAGSLRASQRARKTLDRDGKHLT